MAILVVTGLAGSGKDTVCKQVERRNPSWRIFAFGTTMKERALAHGIFKDKTDDEALKNGRPVLNDQIRALPFPQRMMLQGEVFEVIAKEGSGYNLILNTHAVIPNSELGLQPGLPMDHMMKLKGIPLQLIYLKAGENAEDVALNSGDDKSRQRDVRSPAEIVYQEMMSLANLAAVQNYLNVNLKQVINPRIIDIELRGVEAAIAIEPCLRALERMQAELASLKR